MYLPYPAVVKFKLLDEPASIDAIYVLDGVGQAILHVHGASPRVVFLAHLQLTGSIPSELVGQQFLQFVRSSS